MTHLQARNIMKIHREIWERSKQYRPVKKKYQVRTPDKSSRKQNVQLDLGF